MDQTLLKYWKTCLQDAERKAIALKGTTNHPKHW